MGNLVIQSVQVQVIYKPEILLPQLSPSQPSSHASRELSLLSSLPFPGRQRRRRTKLQFIVLSSPLYKSSKPRRVCVWLGVSSSHSSRYFISSSPPLSILRSVICVCFPRKFLFVARRVLRLYRFIASFLLQCIFLL